MAVLRLIFIVLIFAPFQVFAQIISIAQARALLPGNVVTVRGVVTNGSELGKIRFLQDGTAGIAAFPGTGSAPGFDTTVKTGDSIEVTGPTVSYNGLLEISPVTNWQVISSGNSLPAPKPVMLGQISDALEGQLVSIPCVTFEDAGNFTTSGVYNISDADGSQAIVYLGSGHPLIGSAIPPPPVMLTAIVSEFNDFQLLPRSASDLQSAPCFYFSKKPEQADIQTTGFKVLWQTNLLSSTKLRYGTTPNPSNEIILPVQSMSHSYHLTNLEPGTIYWIQIEAAHNGNIILSETVPFATRSLSSGQIKIYFNHPIDVPTANGLLPDGQSVGEVLGETIARIDAAQQTLDVALYNNNRSDITNALKAAHARGVRVRYIAAAATANTALDPAPPFPVVYGNDESLMHDKMMIIDADLTDKCWVMSGSLNWTSGNINNDFNNTLFIQDQSLARAYELEFEEMWGSSSAQPNPSNSRFGSQKTDNTPHHFIIGDIPVESWFSPSDPVTSRITNAIRTADSEALFAMFTYTHNDMSAALLQVRDEGAEVRGMIENIFDPGEEFSYLTAQGINVKYHSLDGELHHKYAVMDADAPGSAPVVVTGSHNWSYTAETANDENTLIIYDADIALLYKAEFEKRWMENTVSTEVPVFQQIKAFPNPVSDVLSLQFEANSGDNVQVKNVLGSTVLRATATDSEFIRLNVGGLSPGFYFAVIETRHGIATVSFQKI
ncbi:MAG: hypothetical protein OHK0019_13800 [Saprospiraceae bacterium]